MAEKQEIDPEFELGDDEVVSEGQRWSRLEYTVKYARGAREQALKALAQLVQLASTSTDPRIAAMGAQYQTLKAQCDVLAQAQKGDPKAKSGLP